MKLLIFGRNGQIARELIRRAPADIQLTALGHDRADLTDPAACASAICQDNIDGVINAAAWTAVDKAETDEATATIINGEAPAAMARAAAERRIPFLQLSTDYVFDGAGDTPFNPAHATAPLNAYGRSKLKGENGVRAAGGAYLVLRTSRVVSAHGSNFVKTMLRLGTERKHLNVVADQIGGPTPAAAIADGLFIAARALADGAPGGTYHFAGAPDISWAGFARVIMEGAGLRCIIHDIPTSDYPTPATRPLNARLDCSSLAADFGIVRPQWRAGLSDILKEIAAS